MEIIERWTENESQACWGDGAYGHDHIRIVLGSLLPTTYAMCSELRELIDDLNGPMSDSAVEEDEALDLLNHACDDGVYWAFDDGDLILFQEGAEDDDIPTRHSTH